MLNKKKLNNKGQITSLLILLVVFIVGISVFYVYKNSSKKSSENNALNISNTAPKSTESASSTTLDISNLPLGDNKYSTSGAKQGYIFSCNNIGGGGGAFKDGDWINKSKGTWSKKDKNVFVDGSVQWPSAFFKVEDRQDSRDLSGNGLPTNHGTGIFPVERSDDAYSYDRNPNSVKAKNLLKSIALYPAVSSSPRCLNMGAVGYSVNGVAIFNALDGEGRDAAAHEILDTCGGHPERTGEYHYHDYSECMTNKSSEPILIGYILDGFGLYKYPTNPTNADLDECHGKTGEVLWNGKKQSVYHYVVTSEYPYTIGCYKGL